MYLGKNTNVTNAAKESIRRYCLANGLGRDDIADELGIVKGTLDNKLKHSDLKSCFTVEEVLKLCEITDDDSILKSMCADRGLVAYDPIETMPDGGDIFSEVLHGVLKIDIETGNLSKVVHDALEDGVINDEEADAISSSLKSLRSIERKLEIMLKNHQEEYNHG